MLVFIGFMGAGKTTAARAAAAALGGRAVDSDTVVEERLGQRIDDYFASHGEGAFRELEEEVVCELLDNPPGPVVALGGGAAGSPRVREALARHTVVLARAYRQKFGGDHIEDVRAALAAYEERIGWKRRRP